MVEGPKHTPPEKDRARPARVEVFRAEGLAAGEPQLDAVMIRETLEGEPLARTEGLIRWAEKLSAGDPYRKLRQWARSKGRGFYSKAVLRRDTGEVYREYLDYVEVKRAEHEEATGAPTLSPERLDVLTKIFHAPRSRADLARISPAVWAQFQEELESEARHEDVA